MPFWSKVKTWPAASWAWIGANNDPLKLLFGIIAAGYVLFQYQDGLTGERIKRALGFQSRYTRDDMLKARVELNSFRLQEDTKKTIQDAIRVGGSPNDTLATLIREKPELTRHVLLLADFYSQVTTCVDRGLCHLDTSCASFYDHIRSVRDRYFSAFQSWQKDAGENFIDNSFNYFKKNCK
jgi:hypothetical protein